MRSGYIPEHLDFFSRNDRLYKFLLSVGLFVEPVFTDDSCTDIDYLKVTAGLPTDRPSEDRQRQ